jgi:hypothetical protein
MYNESNKKKTQQASKELDDVITERISHARKQNKNKKTVS